MISPFSNCYIPLQLRQREFEAEPPLGDCERRACSHCSLLALERDTRIGLCPFSVARCLLRNASALRSKENTRVGLRSWMSSFFHLVSTETAADRPVIRQARHQINLSGKAAGARRPTEGTNRSLPAGEAFSGGRNWERADTSVAGHRRLLTGVSHAAHSRLLSRNADNRICLRLCHQLSTSASTCPGSSGAAKLRVRVAKPVGTCDGRA